MAIKVRMTPGISIEKAVELINGLERGIKAKFPESPGFVEPDVRD